MLSSLPGAGSSSSILSGVVTQSCLPLMKEMTRARRKIIFTFLLLFFRNNVRVPLYDCMWLNRAERSDCRQTHSRPHISKLMTQNDTLIIANRANVLLNDTTASDEPTDKVQLRSGTSKLMVATRVLNSVGYFKAIIATNESPIFINLSEAVPSNELRNFVDYLRFGTLNLTKNNALSILRISQNFILEVSRHLLELLKL